MTNVSLWVVACPAQARVLVQTVDSRKPESSRRVMANLWGRIASRYVCLPFLSLNRRVANLLEAQSWRTGQSGMTLCQCAADKQAEDPCARIERSKHCTDREDGWREINFSQAVTGVSRCSGIIGCGFRPSGNECHNSRSSVGSIPGDLEQT